MINRYFINNRNVTESRVALCLFHISFINCFQGSLTLKLPVGKAVVQSLSFHPTETQLLTAMEGRVQVWGAEPEETEEVEEGGMMGAS